MPSEIATMKAAYRLPGMEEAVVQRAVPYDSSGLTMDIYRPSKESDRPLPAVVVALGWPDVGVPLPFGHQARELGIFTSWARLFAASGIVGVVYEARNPASDIKAVFARLRTQDGVDGERIGVWAFSGHGPTGFSMLLDGQARCGVISCGYLVDLDGSTAVAEASAQYRFANATAGRQVEELPPLFLARAGQDAFPGLNQSVDAFVTHSLRRNLPVILMNHPSGAHGFDFTEDSKAARHVIRSGLEFLKISLA
jgi:dienelactone hydrolase